MGNFNNHVIILWFTCPWLPSLSPFPSILSELMVWRRNELRKSAFLEENPRLVIYVYNLQSYVVL